VQTKVPLFVKELNAADIQAKMNAYGKKGKPFIAVISYDMTSNYFFPLAEIDPDLVRYAFPAMHNRQSAAKANPPELHFIPPSRTAYQKAFDIVSSHILRGDTYLCNLSFETPVEMDSGLPEIFDHSKARYKLWIKDKFVCFSPESFVRIQGNTIKTYPMKGTIDADIPDAENRLLNDPKEQAEHFTITDLLRNDLSIIAEDVEVNRYRFTDMVETNRNRLFQTSTEITGILPQNWQADIGSMFFRLLPAGSITGAPKKKTVEIISKAENHHRGFYTGVTFVFDGVNADSFVMIRMICKQNNKLVYKSGGGITSFSKSQKEYEELIQKIYVPVY
jgi:para-aminobenzoate synthetase component 1